MEEEEGIHADITINPNRFRNETFEFALHTLVDQSNLFEQRRLEKLANLSELKTTGQKVDLVAAKLLIEKYFKSYVDVSAFKVAALRIIDCVNIKTAVVFKQDLKDDTLWSKVNSTTVVLLRSAISFY